MQRRPMTMQPSIHHLPTNSYWTWWCKIKWKNCNRNSIKASSSDAPMTLPKHWNINCNIAAAARANERTTMIHAIVLNHHPVHHWPMVMLTPEVWVVLLIFLLPVTNFELTNFRKKSFFCGEFARVYFSECVRECMIKCVNASVWSKSRVNGLTGRCVNDCWLFHNPLNQFHL